jgi:regulator of protease activity HflC (stomatin/prohibitin superfamily)
MNKKAQFEVFFMFLIVIGIIGAIAFFMFAVPALKPWWAHKHGQAELAQAEQNRQIAILEARAKHEAATELAQAEIERAKGVAEANRIIGDSLKGNEDYLRYLWIVDVAGGDKQKTVVYVPTEANLPVLEATRLQ